MKNFNDNERQFLPHEVNLILETATKNSPENQPNSLSESQLYEIARLCNLSDSAIESAIEEVAKNQVNSPDSVNRWFQLWRKCRMSGIAAISWAIGLWIGIVIYPITERLVSSEAGVFEERFVKILVFAVVFYVSSLASWEIFNGLLDALSWYKGKN